VRRLATLLLLAAAAAAEVSLPSLFGDHMVVQRDRPVPVWGTADPGEEVTVAFADQTVTTKADADGRWRVDLAPVGATAGRTLRVNGLVLEDVCAGDVWICSGQSNMEMPVARALNAAAEIAASDDPRLRLFTVRHRVADAPAEDVAGEWTAAGPQTVGPFSAVAYFFGRELRRELGVPIGLVHTSWGGTPGEAWMREAALADDPALAPIAARWKEALTDWTSKQRAYARAVAEWKRAVDEAQKGGGALPPRPARPPGPHDPNRPAGLWNAMVAPLVPFAIRGVIWYQGEANAGRAEQYASLFPALIRDWRAAWGQGDFPFLYVQLAGFRPPVADPGESEWAELREAQRLALALPATGMAVAIDIGDAGDIHPRNKQEVGRRLALALRGECGPLYRDHEIAGGKVVVRFDHADGLRAKGDDPLTGFAIAGADRKWRWAHGRVEGQTVVLWHPRIPEPAAVRYDWANSPLGNLENGAGLPASPFRTDDWPLVTAGRR